MRIKDTPISLFCPSPRPPDYVRGFAFVPEEEKVSGTFLREK